MNFNPDTVELVDSSSKREINWEEEQEKLEYIRDSLIAIDNKERKLPASVYEYYGCRMETDNTGENIEVIYYPTYRDGEHRGYRNRKRFQSWQKEVKKHPEKLGVLKDFTGGIGDTQKGIEMFGQWLFPPGGKRIIICCGEEDAMAMWRVTEVKTKFEGGYPVVSCPSGENIAWVKPHIKYLGSFSEIFIVADQDETGRKFEEALCKILPVGKVRLVRLPEAYKDPSSMIQQLGGKKAVGMLWSALWEAEKYSPAGVKSLSEGWDDYLQMGLSPKVKFPESFGDLNQRTNGGGELGEVISFVAASSIGKTTLVKEMIYSALINTNYNIGVVSLEETMAKFIEGILSTHMSTKLKMIPNSERDRVEELRRFNELIHMRTNAEEITEDDVQERIHLVDHQGSCTGHELLEKIDFLIKGLDCKIIIVDPVTLAFSGADTDEDEMASEIVKRVSRHQVLWINVQHVRKSGSGTTANSEGADLAEEDIKGSGAWLQTSGKTVIFTRNKVHENKIIKNTTRIKLTKDREGGETGVAGYIFYDSTTGRLLKGRSPEEILEDSGELQYEEITNVQDGW